MSVTAYKTPQTCISFDRDGKVTWINADNAKASDDARATVTPGGLKYSDWLRCSNFGFTIEDIPIGATIVGIELKVERHGSLAFITDHAIYLRGSGGQTGDNKSAAGTWPIADAEKTYGGAADTWSAGLSDSDIRASTFGIDFSAWDSLGGGGTEARVDCISIRVYWEYKPSQIAASVAVGIAPTATRSTVISRISDILVGTSVVAARATVMSRSCATAVGTAVTATRKVASIPIDIGPEAIDRASAQIGGATFICGGVKAVDLQVVASNCDAIEFDDGSGFSKISPLYTSSVIENDERTNVGLLFTAAGIPQGRKITSAYLEWYVNSAVFDAIECDFLGNDVDNADNFDDDADVTSRARTTASIYHRVTDVGMGWWKSPDISSVIQEVVSREGFDENSNICILVDSTSGYSMMCRFHGYDSSPTLAAKLHVEYLDSDLDELANATGVINGVEVHAYENMTGVKVGTFYPGVEGKFTCRDYVTIGNVTAGGVQTITVDENSDPFAIEVHQGDYWGIYWAIGQLDWVVSGGCGVWAKDGDQFSTGEQTYLLSYHHTFSCHGTGYSGTGFMRPSVVLLGIKVRAPTEYIRKAAVLIGVAVTATRAVVLQRLVEVAIGILPTASRAMVWSRDSLAKLGVKATAMKSHSVVRTASVSLGVAVSAIVGLWTTYERLSTVLIGIKTTAVRSTIISRSAVVLLGVSVSSLLAARFMKIATVAIDITVTASRVWLANRAADVAIGMAIAASAIPTYIRYLRVEAITAQYRQVKVVTAQHRLVKVITAQYRKVRALISGEE